MFQWIRRFFPNLSIWALDDNQCTFPMERFELPPDRIISGLPRAGRFVACEPRIGVVLSLVDHNSTALDVDLGSDCRQISVELWAVLSELASVIIPKPKATPVSALVRRRDPLPPEYIVLHIRALSRDEFKNPDAFILSRLAKALSAELSVPCLIVGRGDSRDPVVSPKVFDLLYDCPLSWDKTIGLLHSACVFIGTDSGPRHLAAAIGTPLICLDHQSSLFRPFCPVEQILSSYTLPTCQNGQLTASIHAVVREVLERQRPGTPTSVEARSVPDWKMNSRQVHA